jgi:hypothetical protein
MMFFNIPSSSEVKNKLQENDDIEYLPKSSSTDLFINLIDRVIFQKWYTEVQIVVNKEYYFTINKSVYLPQHQNSCTKGKV